MAQKVSAVLGSLFFATMASSVWGAQPPPEPPARTPREAAQADLTGYWVAQISEDWRWRMMTPPKGDHDSVPLNAAGVEFTNNWDLERDNANGDQCKAYGAGAIMRLPTRLHITWSDDQTLKLETDAGQQIRIFNFSEDVPTPGERSLQGHSTAEWMRPPPANARAPVPPGGLKVVTRHLLPGYLRKNGVPYSENAVVTEHYHRLTLHGNEYLHVQTIVEDPTYLVVPMVISNHFKREPDGSKWNPTPCMTDPPSVTVLPPSPFE